MTDRPALLLDLDGTLTDSVYQHAIGDCVGDSVWDLLAARRARALGVGLLSGDTGRRSWSTQEPTWSMKTRQTSCYTLMNWGSVLISG